MKLEIISRYPNNYTWSKPLLFIHGAFMGAWVWEMHFLPFLAQQGYEVHALSLRGHGQSEGRERLRWYGLDEYVEDIESAIEEIGEQPILIGHSMGGSVVQRYMRQHELPGVVLMASIPPYGIIGSLLESAFVDPLIIVATTLLQSYLPNDTLTWPTRRLFFSQDLPHHKLRKFLARMQPESLRAILEMNAPLLSRRHSSEVPILVIGGGRDVLIPASFVHRTARYYQTDAWICSSVAHSMMLEKHWRDVADYLVTWLNKMVAIPQSGSSQRAYRDPI